MCVRARQLRVFQLLGIAGGSRVVSTYSIANAGVGIPVLQAEIITQFQVGRKNKET